MFYLFIDDEQRGPFTIEQLAEMGITPETEVWTEGMSDWRQAGDVPQLTTLLQRLEYERHRAADMRDTSATRPAAAAPQPHSGIQSPPPLPHSGRSAPRRQKSGGVKWLIALLILVVLLAVLVVTCPDREAHRQAMLGSTREWVSEKVEQRGVGDIFGEMLKWVTGKGADLTIDQLLVVENHFVYSTGKFNIGDNPKTVSFGILGHVFTFSKDDIDQALRQALDMQQAAPPVQQPGVGITPAPEPDYEEPPAVEDDTLGSVMPRYDDDDAADDLLDSLANKAKQEAIRMAKEWAKKQIDNF